MFRVTLRVPDFEGEEWTLTGFPVGIIMWSRRIMISQTTGEKNKERLWKTEKRNIKTRTSSAYYSNTNEKTQAHVIVITSINAPTVHTEKLWYNFSGWIL
jgi:hypothetical protein